MFSGTVGDTYTPEHVISSQYSPLDQVSALQNFCSANHLLRRFLFLQILSIATGGSSFIQSAFAEIHHLLRGYEMQHLIPIDRYIFNEHPEFLGTVMCRGLRQVFSSALSMLNTLPKEHRLFARILYTKDECALINRNLFTVTSILATAIARQKQETYRHYLIYI